MNGESDIGVVVALKEEFRELFSLIEGRHRVHQDKQTGISFYHFDWGSESSRLYRCVAILIGEMGPQKAGLLTQRLLDYANPRTVVVIGIAGTMSEDVRVGDVIAATQVESYLEDSKAIPSGNSGFRFSLAGQAYRPSENLVNTVKNFEFANREHFVGWQEQVRDDLRQLVDEETTRSSLVAEDIIRESSAVHEGHVASGSTVGASQAFIDFLKKKDRKYIGIEMESGGVLAAVCSGATGSNSLVLRGISDCGDNKKTKLDNTGGGVLRRYAMLAALRFLLALVETGCFPRHSANDAYMAHLALIQESEGEMPADVRDLLDEVFGRQDEVRISVTNLSREVQSVLLQCRHADEYVVYSEEERVIGGERHIVFHVLRHSANWEDVAEFLNQLDDESRRVVRHAFFQQIE